ncbi:MAG: hypothetical protein JTT11_09600, partial [Candidatus Brockarchaeota archaeon]|nr:hypothetical protein [Candidatus Brockarchaeota archaeon]
ASQLDPLIEGLYLGRYEDLVVKSVTIERVNDVCNPCFLESFNELKNRHYTADEENEPSNISLTCQMSDNQIRM